MEKKTMEMQQGEQLLKSIIELTGVPENQMETVIHEILSKTGQDVDSLTLDQFRAAMLVYLDGLQLAD